MLCTIRPKLSWVDVICWRSDRLSSVEMGLPEITRTLFASRVALYTIRRGARGFGKIQLHRISSRASYDASVYQRRVHAAHHKGDVGRLPMTFARQDEGA